MSAPAQYWYFLISGHFDELTGVIGNFYAYGQHCGEALENALQAAAQECGFNSPSASEAARLDTLEDFEEPDDLVALTSNVFRSAENYSYPLDTVEHEFIAPTGIIKSTEDGEFDYELIKNCFMAYKSGETGAYEFELVADKSRLINTFLQAVQFVLNPAQLSVIIRGHWEGQKSELWSKPLTQSDDNNPATFWEEQCSNLLENGFVDCLISWPQHETKLTLDEHKKITFHTLDESVFNDFGQRILALDFEQVTEQYGLDFGYYHWHYRPADSLDAPELRVLLLDAGFRFEKSWEDEPTEELPDSE
ncbi:hypothetical protein Q5H93_20785 [Hymenobacter sp. ASUV-10]|uniref:DUF695 domain-containing protein n=1 Tax=Hymenobacter aranciens TaxID=3063996 RepID=A0ABT9BHB6_9BACT|nr:hypothetical protein [Hymenobacter sp. ASUV-10]MDO7877195.1 hypothetical protein [Hymenobacter sp. ASUV-10]